MIKNISKNQTGSMIIMGLLLLVLITIIAGTGWYVWYSKQVADKSLNEASQSAQSITSSSAKMKTAQPAPTTAPSSTQKYLTISEWGVRAPYSSDDTLTYTLSSDQNAAEISSKILDDQFPSCANYNGVGVGGAAGTIARNVGTDGAYEDGTGPEIADYAKQYPGNYTHIGKYYYSFHHAQETCDTDPKSEKVQNTASNEVKALVVNLKSE